MDLYSEIILDHYHHPRNFGSLENPDYYAEEYNSLCGDRIEIFLNIKNHLVQDVKFQGEGCAISQASASLLTDHVKKLKNMGKIKQLSEADALRLLGIDLTPARRKCALIAYLALRKAVNHSTPNP